MRFELFVASRYLRAKRRQAVVGVITTISIVGVAAGVASLILALAITNGMQRDLQKGLLSSTAQVQLMRVANDGIEHWRSLTDRMRRLPHVTAAAPALYGQVLISRGARSGGALVKGILPSEERTVSSLLDDIKQGTAAPLEPAVPATNQDSTGSTLSPLVLGSDLADTIGAGVGDSVLVTSPQGELTPFGLVPKYERFQVVGIFHSGFYQYDSSFALARLTDIQHLFGEPNVVSIVSFKVDDMYDADRIGKEIEKAAGSGFMTNNWMEQNQELFHALREEQAVTFIVIGLIVCVAALNILIALTMMVMEKTRDIAVLMSYGVRPSQVRRIFVWQGMLIGFLGTSIGLVVGYALAWAGGHYRIIHLSAAVYSLDYLPFAPRWQDGVIVAAVALGVSLLATLYPSSSAAKILPAEALRYE
jgi:lipoprotein-releasing system permease protein